EATSLVVSGNGTRLAWIAQGATLRSGQALTTTGTELKTLLTDSHYVIDNPAISADGTRVAFISTANLTGQNPTKIRALYRRNCDGTDLKQLVIGESTYDAQISPDGNVIFYTKFPP